MATSQRTGVPEPLDFAARDTPLQSADRLGAALGLEAGRLHIKRDDLTGLAGGGNKARKLELLVADALAVGADALVTTGAAQSNHVRATGAAARRAGLECVAVLTERHPKTVAEGNLVLDDLLGIRVVWTTYSKQRTNIDRAIETLQDDGRVPYEISFGGSSPLGSAAYAWCADEIEHDAPGATVVCANGSGGTHAGLVAGFGDHRRVLGVDVGGLAGLDALITQTASSAAELLGRPEPSGLLQMETSQTAAPYGEPTDEAIGAIRLAAETEGLILDPVYSGRALAGLIRALADDSVPAGPVVFVHTGGMPALFTERYREWFAIQPFHSAEAEPQH